MSSVASGVTAGRGSGVGTWTLLCAGDTNTIRGSGSILTCAGGGGRWGWGPPWPIGNLEWKADPFGRLDYGFGGAYASGNLEEKTHMHVR